MDMFKVLIVEDEQDIRVLMKTYLASKGYDVVEARNGLEALLVLKEMKVDLILCDVMMPLLDGFNFLRELRKTSVIPLIFLTARGDSMDKILGLGLGADDYLVKPVEMEELSARVDAKLRRMHVYGVTAESNQQAVLKNGNLLFDLNSYTVTLNQKPIELTAKELKLLQLFMMNIDKVFTKKQLYKSVWDEDYLYDDNTIMVTLSRLRGKIECAGECYIHTIRGIGYKMLEV